jgi:NADP-dependent aldehyde dehydrogenase
MTDTTPEQLDRVLDDAVAAAAVLRTRTPSERAGWLRAAADALDAAADRLLPLALEESHLPLPRLTGELKRTTFQLRLFADEVDAGAYLHATIDHGDPGWGMGPRPDLRRMLVPIGPVAVWAASNFPFAFSVAGGDTASALAAGSPVVLVAHPGHPRLSEATAEVLVAALEGAGAPRGVFTLVEGQDTGRALITDPRIAAGAFTGSLRGGRALFDLASGRETPIPFYGELGSVNPAFVTVAAATSRPEAVAEGFAGSMSLGVGQFCTKPGLLFVPADSSIPALVAERLRQVAGAPMLNERIRAGYGDALATLAAHEVVEVLQGSVEPDPDPAPTLLRTSAAEVLADPRPLTAEVFGPAALIVEYVDDEQLLAAARVLEGQLTATIQGEADDRVVPALLDVLSERAGRVLWNGWPTGVTVSYAQQHGGPYPATTAVGTTSVGTAAIERFLRPVAYQDLPQAVLPEPLQDANPWSVPQRIDGTQHP